MAVPITIENTVLEAGLARELFRGDFALGFYLEGGAWDVSGDGQRFVLLRDSGGQISMDTRIKMR
jgi:hypothetical protein